MFFLFSFPLSFLGFSGISGISFMLGFSFGFPGCSFSFPGFSLMLGFSFFLQKFLIARISVDTPYYKEELVAMCRKAPIHDLVITNIHGSCRLEELDQAVNSEEVAAVTTRARESDISNVSAQVLKEAQQIDPTLGRIWESARAESQQKTRGKTTYRYEVQKGILYWM